MSTKVANFVSKIVIHFPVRFESDAREVEWLRSIIDAVGYYDASVLDRAAQKIIDTRTDRRFPLPAEIRKVCQQVVADDNAQKLPIQVLGAKAEADSDERVRLANDLVRTEIGRQAAREGWIGALHDYARRNARLPSQAEIGRIKMAARGFDEAFAECVRGGWGSAAGLAALGDKMLARREELRTMVLGEGA